MSLPLNGLSHNLALSKTVHAKIPDASNDQFLRIHIFLTKKIDYDVAQNVIIENIHRYPKQSL